MEKQTHNQQAFDFAAEKPALGHPAKFETDEVCPVCQMQYIPEYNKDRGIDECFTCIDRNPMPHYDRIHKAFNEHLAGRSFIEAEIYKPYWMMRRLGVPDNHASYFFLWHNVNSHKDFIDVMTRFINSGEWGAKRAVLLDKWRQEAVVQLKGLN